MRTFLPFTPVLMDALRSGRGGAMKLALVALLCFGWHLWDWFPGVSSPDTDYQYHQARTGHYTDWHPPLMALLWSVMPFFDQKMASMFVLHLALYWLALALIAMRMWKDGYRLQSWLPLLMGLSPILSRTLAGVVKDTGLGIAFLLAFALAFWFRAAGRRIPWGVRGVIGVLVFYGLLVRHNGYFGAPLVLYLLWPKLVERPARYVGGFVAVVLLSMGGMHVLNYQILHAEKLRLMTAVQIFDLTGTAYFSEDPKVVGEGITMQDVRDCYTPVSCDTLMFQFCKPKFWESAGKETDMRWLRAMWEHPLAYLTHRALNFNEAMYFITSRNKDSARVFAWYMFKYKPYGEWVGLRQFARQLAITIPVFSPAFALATGMALAVLFRPRRGRPRDAYEDAILQLAMAGAVYLASYFIAGVSAMWRYDFWGMLAVYVALFLALPRLSWQGPRTREGWWCAALLVALYCVMLGAYLYLGDAFSQLKPTYGPPAPYQL